MTQTQWVLEALKQGLLTPLQALNEGGIFRLAARIGELRQAGHDITTNNLTLPSGKVVAQYHLNQLKQAA